MRKYLILILIACFCYNEVEAQKRTGKKGRHKGPSSRKAGGGRGKSSNGSLLIGVPVSGLSTWLPNGYLKSQPTGTQDLSFSVGYQAGLLIGYEFGGGLFSIHASGMYSMHQQKYTGRLKGYSGQAYYDYTSASVLNLIDIPLLFQFEGAGGGFFEAGPMYSIVNKATYKIDDYLGSRDIDAAQWFPSSRISAVVDFGMDASLDDGKWFLKIGFRGIYTFTDMLGVNALGIAYHPILTSEVTKCYAGGIHLALVYKAGY